MDICVDLRLSKRGRSGEVLSRKTKDNKGRKTLPTLPNVKTIDEDNKSGIQL